MLWRQHGDLNNAATGLGLHRDRDLDPVPNITTEMKRRIWSVVFSLDKTIAAFTGRPPGLSHRYSACPQPLDISDETLLAPREERERAIHLLDSNGWNTSSEYYPATSCRAILMHSLILSEVLEMSLGSESLSDARLMCVTNPSPKCSTNFVLVISSFAVNKCRVPSLIGLSYQRKQQPQTLFNGHALLYASDFCTAVCFWNSF